MPKEIWFVFIGAKDAQKVFPPGLPTVVAMLLLNGCPKILGFSKEPFLLRWLFLSFWKHVIKNGCCCLDCPLLLPVAGVLD
jgi:hypothetical protein